MLRRLGPSLVMTGAGCAVPLALFVLGARKGERRAVIKAGRSWRWLPAGRPRRRDPRAAGRRARMAHPHSVPAVPAQGSDEALLAVAVGIACLVVVAVCDVYDALVSPLVCRDAWPAERALSLLRDESGTAFDHACVAALERVLEGAETPAAADAAAAVPVPA